MITVNKGVKPMKKLTYRGIAYQKNDNANETLTRVPGKVSHVYRGAVYHYEKNNNNEKTSV